MDAGTRPGEFESPIAAPNGEHGCVRVVPTERLLELLHTLGAKQGADVPDEQVGH